MMTEINTDAYAEFQTEEAPSQDKLAQLAKLADQMMEAEEAVAEAENALKDRQKKLRQLAENEIPELMAEVGMEEFKTSGGLKIKIRTAIRCGALRGSKNQEAIDWLEEHGHGGLIKRTFTILFGRDDEKWANKFAGDLKKRKKPLDSKTETQVHAQTLAAWIAEQQNAGLDIDLDMFGAFEQKIAKLDTPKGK